MKETCWAFSNITAGSTSNIEKFIEHHAFERVLEIAMNATNPDHRKEALWVVGNAVTGSDWKMKE